MTRSPAADRLRDALESSPGIRYRVYRMRPYAAIEERLLPDASAGCSLLGTPERRYTASSNSRSTSFRLSRRSCEAARQPTINAQESS